MDRGARMEHPEFVPRSNARDTFGYLQGPIRFITRFLDPSQLLWGRVYFRGQVATILIGTQRSMQAGKESKLEI